MNWPIWYTCLNCPPHGVADHSLYGDKKCLTGGCPCEGYVKDDKNPIIRSKKPLKIRTPLPDRPL